MLDLWLIRHAESFGNLDDTGSDTGLSPKGQEQALSLRNRLAGFVFEDVCTSPLLRARQTVALAMPRCTPVVDARLAELADDPGPHYVDPSNLEELRALLARPPVRPAESGKEFMTRVNAWRAGLSPDGRVVAFTHAGVIRELLSAFLGFHRAPQQVGYTAIFRLEIGSGAPTVIAWHDDAHLADPRAVP